MKRTHVSLAIAATALTAGALAACSDERPVSEGGAGGTTTTTTSTTSATGSTTTSSSTSSSTGTGGAAPEELLPPCTKQAELSGDITASTTLKQDTCYSLKGINHVKAGATLTIEKGTVIKGDKASLGTLVIDPGAKIMAEGSAVNPIVFTSALPKGQRAAGDWGGVILLGKAPINVTGAHANIEGIPITPETTYGGTDPNDSSGKLKYVRIEFSGVLLSPNNEINGLTFGGVGAGTEIDYVMVHDTLDDCFEFFGGTVHAKHLVCAFNQDDGFDWDFGFTGKLQFLALIQDPDFPDDTNGFEGDNDANASANTPFSEPTIYNATLCGHNKDVAKQQFGMLLRRSTKGHIFNTIVTGFEAGVDVRDPLTSVEIKSSIFFGQTVAGADFAYAEVASGAGVTSDDDNGFDEINALTSAGNQSIDPKINCFQAVPDFRPMATLTSNAATPPSDGFFDTSASYIGAFKAGDDWATGNWISYDRN